MNRFLFLVGLMFCVVASAQSLFVINPSFANVPIQCSDGYAYQSTEGETCADSYPQQRFNTEPGIGWRFSPTNLDNAGSGLTNPNSAFNPPPFTGLPFSTAAFLEGPSEVVQTIHGFIPGVVYALSFYLGSRYNSLPGYGDQTVQAKIDGKVLTTIGLVSYTPFTFHTAYFGVATSGPHVLAFEGISSVYPTAFFSGVHIEAVAANEIK